MHNTEACREIMENPIETCEEKLGCDCTIQKGDDTKWLNLQHLNNISITGG